MDEALMKRRMVITVAITIACAIVAMASIVAGMVFHVGWLNYVFWICLAVGFGSQILMIVRFWLATKKP